jgi:hypothetical protein
MLHRTKLGRPSAHHATAKPLLAHAMKTTERALARLRDARDDRHGALARRLQGSLRV